ncbi:MAG: redoxin domain-containing protein, partial [Planctomycetota bacterium]|nr:redoxin domain-containing protein [Planctomycetota bacterium]
MIKRRQLFSMLAFATMLVTTASYGASMGDAKAKVGEAAPSFTLSDADGKEFSLSDFKGKTVVLQWINPDCPVCRRVSGSGLMG